jgi:hypothetical protein
MPRALRRPHRRRRRDHRPRGRPRANRGSALNPAAKKVPLTLQPASPTGDAKKPLSQQISRFGPNQDAPRCLSAYERDAARSPLLAGGAAPETQDLPPEKFAAGPKSHRGSLQPASRRRIWSPAAAIRARPRHSGKSAAAAPPTPARSIPFGRTRRRQQRVRAGPNASVDDEPIAAGDAPRGMQYREVANRRALGIQGLLHLQWSGMLVVSEHGASRPAVRIASPSGHSRASRSAVGRSGSMASRRTYFGKSYLVARTLGYRPRPLDRAGLSGTPRLAQHAPMDKLFISADSLLRDSMELARRIVASGLRPTFLVAMWRGGTPIGIAVQEVLEYHSIHADHIAIRTSSYTGIDTQDKTVRVHALGLPGVALDRPRTSCC